MAQFECTIHGQTRQLPNSDRRYVIEFPSFFSASIGDTVTIDGSNVTVWQVFRNFDNGNRRMFIQTPSGTSWARGDAILVGNTDGATGNSISLPLGIPAPGFGLYETLPNTATYVVNNQHPSATDTSNPNGTADVPRLTIPTTLPAGAVVEVHTGYYVGYNMTWTANGTNTSPVFIKGVGTPVIVGVTTGARGTRLAGTYLIVDGLTFYQSQIEITGTAVAVRNCEVLGCTMTAVAASGIGQVLYNNHIHHNGNSASLVEQDYHGILVSPASLYTWVINNHIHHNSGDSIQVGQASTSLDYAYYVFIGGNTMHEDRENAVDIKRAQDVVVSQNFCYGYHSTNSSSGECIVVHDNPQRVWVINNVLAAGVFGVVCSAASTIIVAGNLFININHEPQYSYDANSYFTSAAILVYGSSSIAIDNNTVWNCDAGISIPNGGAAEVVNNLAVLKIANVISANASSRITNNLTPTANTFVNATASNFRLASSATTAIGSGNTTTIFSSFNTLYGTPIDKDLYGTTRNSPLDIGAVAYVA